MLVKVAMVGQAPEGAQSWMVTTGESVGSKRPTGSTGRTSGGRKVKPDAWVVSGLAACSGPAPAHPTHSTHATMGRIMGEPPCSGRARNRSMGFRHLRAG